MEGAFPLKLVKGVPAALVGKTLVLADLHMGIEREYWRAGVRISGLSKKVYEAVEALLDRTNPRKIVINGDFKHNIPDFTRKEMQEVQRTYALLESQGEVIIVKGNHDGNLEEILPGAHIVPGSGTKEGRAFFFHGHAWPDPDIFSARIAVMAHVHPAFSIKQAFWTFTEKCWVLTEFLGEKAKKRYANPKNVPLIVMPAFSPFITGVDVSEAENWVGPLGENGLIGGKKIFLLDGTLVAEF